MMIDAIEYEGLTIPNRTFYGHDEGDLTFYIVTLLYLSIFLSQRPPHYTD